MTTATGTDGTARNWTTIRNRSLCHPTTIENRSLFHPMAKENRKLAERVAKVISF